MKKVFKIIGLILLALVVLVFAFIGILTLTEYKPADEAIDRLNKPLIFRRAM